MYLVDFIYTSVPDYMSACLDALQDSGKYKITVVETTHNPNYPVKLRSERYRTVTPRRYIDELKNNEISTRGLRRVVFISGWANQAIMKIAAIANQRQFPLILCTDQMSKHNIKQFVGRFLLRNYLKQFKKAFVPGRAAMELMLYYGFRPENIKTGLYSANNNIFDKAFALRSSYEPLRKSFLFSGQFIKRKGFDSLLREYREYQRQVHDPWKLIVLGKGDLELNVPNDVENIGFVHPASLAEVYSRATCFVLPSREDHWPLVVHEASISGLPMLISPTCGNHHELFRETKNGFFVHADKAGSISRGMILMHKSERIGQMSLESRKLSSFTSITKWVESARSLIEGCFSLETTSCSSQR